MFAFSVSLHLTSVLESELWGIFNGLKLAWNRGFRKIKVYYDSMGAIKMLKRRLCSYSPTTHTCGKHSTSPSEF
ncbi:ribonuclease H protein, partial [Trifolium medium]|nr:ribonuclease H protein [Trifolium medium]